MTDNSQNNKRIAKNTIMLYTRMLFTMGVSLFTSRVVLQTLGAEDYGIYNVVGGIVVLFTFVNGAMVSTTQRYLTYEIGKNNLQQLKKVFSTSLQIHAIIALIVLILGETVGLWFLYEKLVIPVERMTAATWVFQCSIIACVVSIMAAPYNALVISYEKMSAFAYISVLESVLKLIIVYALYLAQWDKLITYAILTLIVQLLIRFTYTRYCKKHFAQIHYYHHFDKSLFKEMTSFAGWSLITPFTYVLNSQGISIMLNIFFGPIANAARAIAVLIQGMSMQFVNSLQMAINPQIIKNYASSQVTTMHSLMSRCARFSYFLLFLLSLPILIETEYLLGIWLTEVPENTIIFTRLILIRTLLLPFSNPLTIANQASGKVKTYEIVSGIILLLLLPLSYIALKLEAPAYFVYIIHIILESFTLIYKLLYTCKEINMPLTFYITSALLPAFVVTLISSIFPIIVFNLIDNNLLRFICVIGMSVISVLTSIGILGITKSERGILIKNIKSVVRKYIK